MEGDREISRIVIQSRHFNPLPPHGGRRPEDKFDFVVGSHFNPLPPHGGRQGFPEIHLPLPAYFNPLPPHGGRRPEDKFDFVVGSHFNPLPPHGGRQGFPEIHLPLPAYFNPLPPHGGRREHRLSDIEEALHFNPLPPHGGRREIPADWNCHEIISIHSLRMEGDLTQQQQNYVFANISIHSLRMEGDSSFCSSRNGTFYISIHSLRMEGDAQLETIAFERLYFNPLPPHGGRRKVSPGSNGGKNFNPLPPHGGRPILVLEIFPDDLFQSTPSAWRETLVRASFSQNLEISIHSLRMEGDCENKCRVETLSKISIHSLRMEGDCFFSRNILSGTSISIHSLRMEGDDVFIPCHDRNFISIHSLRMEGDYFSNAPCAPPQAFQSTPSAWRETFHRSTNANKSGNFNPLPPHGGRQGHELDKEHLAKISIHSLRMEGDVPFTTFVSGTKKFQSTPSAWRETSS